MNMKNLQNNVFNMFEFDNSQKQEISPLGISLNNFKYIVGTDEAGRGPAAGGVWAAAVCFFEDVDKNIFLKLNDSKKLNHKTREELFDLIVQNSYFSIQVSSVSKIEKMNILNASLDAMKKAVYKVSLKLKEKSILTLVDGNRLIKNFDFPQKTIVKGDSTSASIAAASILAKVARDRYMDNIDKICPSYDWKNNKGYLSKKHIEAIKEFGPSKFHRFSFLKNILEEKTK